MMNIPSILSYLLATDDDWSNPTLFTVRIGNGKWYPTQYKNLRSSKDKDMYYTPVGKMTQTKSKAFLCRRPVARAIAVDLRRLGYRNVKVVKFTVIDLLLTKLLDQL